ncbi:MAG: alpha/beta fold hydrolase [Polyangiaceae bacterium]|nr:alpha/beta fold hydrolase [Polyangiaceae bacterium]
MIPLVLLHGFTGSPRTFDELRQTLPPDRPVLCPLLSGHGGAPFPTAIGTFLDEVDRLASAIAEWFAEPVHLAGYSLGARLALTLMLTYPEQFARATLVGVNSGLTTAATRAGRRGQDAVWARLLDQGDLITFVDKWEQQPLFGTALPQSSERRAAQRWERLEHDPRGLAQALRVLGLGEMPNQLPHLKHARVPCELVVGELDTAFRAHAARIIEACPHIPLHLVPDTGHNVPRESPEALARILMSEENGP